MHACHTCFVRRWMRSCPRRWPQGTRALRAHALKSRARLRWTASTQSRRRRCDAWAGPDPYPHSYTHLSAQADLSTQLNTPRVSRAATPSLSLRPALALALIIHACIHMNRCVTIRPSSACRRVTHTTSPPSPVAQVSASLRFSHALHAYMYMYVHVARVRMHMQSCAS